jgi:hypothetical protein
MQNKALTRATLRTPKAAALAGIVFCILLFVIIWLLRQSMPGNPLDAGEWISANARMVRIALNLIPFAGIAFLWFIGVLRDRLEEREDRFFATVFFGSALVFLAMLFAAAAIIGALILTATSVPSDQLDSPCVSFRPRNRVSDHERLCREDGRRLYDLDVHDTNLYGHCTALDRNTRFRACRCFVGRQFVRDMECRRPTDLGAADQRLHSC